MLVESSGIEVVQISTSYKTAPKNLQNVKFCDALPNFTFASTTDMIAWDLGWDLMGFGSMGFGLMIQLTD